MHLICLGLAILIGFVARADAAPLIFEGRIEAVERTQIYSRAEGRVSEVFATAGTRVEEGAILARLESDLAELAVEAARADLERHDALLRQAQDRLDRVERLSQSGSSSPVSLLDAETDLQLAQAEHRAAEIVLARAEIDLADTEIRATHPGIIEAVEVGVGALLEFDAGMPPLFEIIDLDPVRVVYAVPYAERLQQMTRLNLTRAEDLLKRIRLDLKLPDGTPLATGVTPEATSVRVDRDTGTLLVWAHVVNPDAILRPGMQIVVHSTITDQPHERVTP